MKYIVPSMFMLWFIFVIVWYFWVEANLCRFLIGCLYIYCYLRSTYH